MATRDRYRAARVDDPGTYARIADHYPAGLEVELSHATVLADLVNGAAGSAG
ncbi:hypothetical protein GCM10011512_09070 [Tersicoccus solisilvae]|uniref:Uncharacterized protein n=1 Tax=Tersicoccus solisilvae TaxID=1882339 RepID=A0ABQ1NSN2_9MICC|nr:hypothetical protein [Tersicoccus solisilvae]GGC84417.1 hypothetical protein GCM10011512_09070 [Tersicoccus solisilvae]